MPSRPNMLVIMTDQQSHAAMGCAGNDAIATPAMDSLAAAGVRFSQSYCTYPLCTPSRASMFTGQWPHAIDVMDNGRPIPDAMRTTELGGLFSRAGYDCVYGGKWHVPEIAMPDGQHGFRTICGFDDTHLADRCIDYLRARHDRPFLMVASFDNPHNICEWARGQVLPWGPIEERPLECCPNLPPNHASTGFEPEAIRMEQAWSPRVYPVLNYSAERWRRYRNAYLRLVEKVDAEIGRILAALRDAGLARDTLVVFTSDHGDGMGAHHWNQKSVLYDEIVRVPLLLSWPGVIPEGRVDPRLVSTGLDLLPTLCDYAGISAPEGLPGRSLREAVERASGATWRDQVCAETVLGRPIRMEGRMVRTARFKYVVYSYGLYREQLYDLERDPGEMVNLAVEERHSGVLAEHRRRLRDWCLETGDRFEEHSSHPGLPTVPGYEYV